MTAAQVLAAIAAIAGMIATPALLVWLAARSPVIDATDASGADEGGVAR